MFCPDRMIVNARWGYVSRFESYDFKRGERVPWRIRLNPLRYTIGIGRRRPCWLVINRHNARTYVAGANALYAVKKRLGLVHP